MLEFKRLILFVFLLLSLASCAENSANSSQELSLDELYLRAVKDAIIADSSEISYNLIPIVRDNDNLHWQSIDGNEMVLVNTFTKYISSYPIGETVELVWGEVWVTVVPELKSRLWGINFSSDSVLSLRIHQLLGLPFKLEEKYFVEMWVNPEDIFRPSPDNEITDNTAGLYFSDDTPSEYIDWFNSNIIYSYFPSYGGKPYPWTRLGYTYDWGNRNSSFGISEFVIRKGSKVHVEKVSSISEYLTIE